MAEVNHPDPDYLKDVLEALLSKGDDPFAALWDKMKASILQAELDQADARLEALERISRN